MVFIAPLYCSPSQSRRASAAKGAALRPRGGYSLTLSRKSPAIRRHIFRLAIAVLRRLAIGGRHQQRARVVQKGISSSRSSLTVAGFSSARASRNSMNRIVLATALNRRSAS